MCGANPYAFFAIIIGAYHSPRASGRMWTGVVRMRVGRGWVREITTGTEESEWLAERAPHHESLMNCHTVRSRRGCTFYTDATIRPASIRRICSQALMPTTCATRGRRGVASILAVNTTAVLAFASIKCALFGGRTQRVSPKQA